MKKVINGVSYNTETAKELDAKTFGSFGDADGYEEKLYITKTKQYFLSGAGGPESPYTAPTIKPITKEQAAEWGYGVPAVKDTGGTKAKKTARAGKAKSDKADKGEKPVKEKKPRRKAEPKKS